MSGVQTGAIQVSPASDEQAKACKSWPTWGCGVSKFPWFYDQQEAAYIVRGKVTVTPDGGEPVEIKAGDYCVFPAGMGCTWDVQEALFKHYDFS